MNRLFNLAIPFFFLALCSSAYAAETVNVSSIDSPPYYTATPKPGEKHGVAIDLMTEIWKTQGVDVSYTFIPIARADWSIIGKRHDAMLGTPKWFSKNNSQSKITSVNLLKIRFMFFYKKDHFPNGISYNTLSEFKKYRIGNVRGSSTIPLLEKAGLNLELVSEVKQNFIKLNAGRIDLVVGVELSGWAILKELFPASSQEFATIDKPFFTAYASAIFLKEKILLINKFKRGLEEIIKNGTYKKILQDYYGPNQSLEEVIPSYLHDEM